MLKDNIKKDENLESEETKEVKPEELQEKEKDSKEADGKESIKDSAENTEEDEKAKEKEESDRYIRLMADFQNYKNRVEKQKSEIFSFANEKIIIKLLDVLDNFHRALDAESENKAFKDGMAMILKQLESVLVENGLAEIEAKDVDFDPNMHNAVMVEDIDGIEENKIVEVFQKGYTLNGKVIRPSMVKVSK